jgi:electron transfer flavoprotein alpha subunit
MPMPRGLPKPVAKIAGVEKVLLATDPAYGHMLPENVAPLAAQAMAGYDAFVAPATTTGKNVAPRVAALLDVMQLSEVIAIEGPRDVRPPDLCRQRHRHGREQRRQAGADRARHRVRQGRRRRRLGGDRTVSGPATRACRASSRSTPRRASGPS